MDSGAAGLQGGDVHVKLHLAFNHRKSIQGKEPTCNNKDNIIRPLTRNSFPRTNLFLNLGYPPPRLSGLFNIEPQPVKFLVQTLNYGPLLLH